MQCPSKRGSLIKFDCSNNRREGAPPWFDRLRPARLLGGKQVLANIYVDQPFDARHVQSVEQYGIEATRGLAPQIRQKKAGRELDPAALGGGDAGTRSAEGAAAAQAHFDEHQRCSVTRDEIDLAAAAAIVSLDH